MLAYEISEADLAPVPTSYRTEPRYLGYRQADRAKPYAGFFREDTLPVQPHVAEALLAGMAPTEFPFIGQNSTAWTLVCAGSVIALLPIVLIFMVLQRLFFNGPAGAVKG